MRVFREHHPQAKSRAVLRLRDLLIAMEVKILEYVENSIHFARKDLKLNRYGCVAF